MRIPGFALVFLGLVGVMLFAPGAIAQSSPERLALKGYDTVAYFTEQRAMPGNAATRPDLGATEPIQILSRAQRGENDVEPGIPVGCAGHGRCADHGEHCRRECAAIGHHDLGCPHVRVFGGNWSTQTNFTPGRANSRISVETSLSKRTRSAWANS